MKKIVLKDGRTINKRSLLWICKRVKGYIPKLLIVTVFTVCGSFLGVIFSLGTKDVIDSATYGQLDGFIWSAIRLMSIIIGMVLCNVINRHMSITLNAFLERDLKKKIMNMILYSDYKAISKYHSGDLVHRLNVDIGSIVSGIMTVTSNFASLIVQTVSVVIVLSSVSPLFTVAMIILCVLVATLYFSLRNIIKDFNKRINKASGKISGFLQEMTEKLLIVKGLNVVDKIEDKEENLLEDRWLIQKSYRKFNVLSSSSLIILSYLIGFISLLWCAFQMMQGNMSFGSLTAITTLVGQLATPIFMLPSLISQLFNMSASAERLQEIEDLDKVCENLSCDVEKIYKEMDKIEVKDLFFAYDRDNVINGVSFYIPKNSMTVIMGSSGIGKSTLLKILLGIYKPDNGSLQFVGTGENIDIDEKVRAMFSYVPQENLLLSGTIRENITLVNSSASDDEIKQALYVCAMDDFVYSLPDGVDTRLGENASGLSEGQAQRLSLARAVLSGAPILLLDEVTSALDEQTEKTVLSRIHELKDKTCIVVTHRPAVLDLADWLLNFSKEEVACSSVKH